MALPTPQSTDPSPHECARAEFTDICRQTRFAVLDKVKYDEIIEVLRGNMALDKSILRRQRNATTRYVLIGSGDAIALVRKNNSAFGDWRRIVHSDELFDIISNAHQETQLTSATGLYSYLHARYSNISLELCSAYLKCYRKATPPALSGIREGFFSLIDMRKLDERHTREKWILLYQDFPTQRIYARELTSASANTTALELCKIFITDGPPEHLYSNSKRKFIKRVLKYTSLIQPGFEILLKKGRHTPYHLHNLKDFKARLLLWINDHLTIVWTIGIYVCAADLTKSPMNLDSNTDFRVAPCREVQGIIQEASKSSRDISSMNEDSHSLSSAGAHEEDNIFTEDSHNQSSAVAVFPDDRSIICEDSYNQGPAGVQDGPYSRSLLADDFDFVTREDPPVPLVTVVDYGDARNSLYF